MSTLQQRAYRSSALPAMVYDTCQKEAMYFDGYEYVGCKTGKRLSPSDLVNDNCNLKSRFRALGGRKGGFCVLHLYFASMVTCMVVSLLAAIYGGL